MAGFAMNEKSPLAALAAALIALTATACSPAAREAPPLEGARIGGPFTLTDQNGRKVSDTSFPGKYKLIYFGYTFCPDVCPVDLQLIGRGLAAFEKSDPARAAKVQPIFITTDPERDTPPVLKEYVAAFHPRLIGLTGTPQQIARLVIYVTDKSEYCRRTREVGARWRSHMGRHFPAMALIEVKGLLEDEAKVEIEGIAVIAG